MKFITIFKTLCVECSDKILKMFKMFDLSIYRQMSVPWHWKHKDYVLTGIKIWWYKYTQVQFNTKTTILDDSFIFLLQRAIVLQVK